MKTTDNRVQQWYEELRATYSLTKADAEELLVHLVDSIEELKAAGLDDADAFEVARVRLGSNFNYEKEYSLVNSDVLLIRKVVLVFTGIIVYFFFHFLMASGGRLLFYLESKITEPHQLFRNICLYFFCYHLFIFVITFSVYKWKYHLITKFEDFKIKPIHIFTLILLVFGLNLANFQLHQLISNIANLYLTTSGYFEVFGYAGYSFALTVSICFILLLRKKSLSGKKLKKQKIQVDKRDHLSDSDELKEKHREVLNRLVNEGLEEEEAIRVINKRDHIPGNETILNLKQQKADKQLRFILIALSGVLVNLSFYFFLHATSKVLLIFLQHMKNNPIRNLAWFEWYIFSFNLVLIFFSTSIYLQDKNLLMNLKRLKLKHFYFIFFLAILLAVIDSGLLPFARSSLNNLLELKRKFNETVQLTNFIFPLVVSFCFLLVFSKYFQKNKKRNH